MMAQAEKYVQSIKQKLSEDLAIIVLFGSVSRNNANINSDIDILIVHFGDSEFERRLDAETFDFMMKNGAPIECVYYRYFQVKYNPSYFVKYNLENGLVLYMKNQNELKEKEIKGYLELSEIFETDAKDCFERNRLRAAIDLGYNSIELKIKALLLNLIETLPSSHGGLISKFGEHYILTKKISKVIGTKLHKTLRLRNSARYDPQATFTNEDGLSVLSLIDELSKFMDKFNL